MNLQRMTERNDNTWYCGKGWSKQPYKEFREFGRMLIETQDSNKIMRCIWYGFNMLKTQITMKLIPDYGVAQVAEFKTPEAPPIQAAQEEKMALQIEI